MINEGTKKIRKDIQKNFSPKKSVGNTRHNNFFRGKDIQKNFSPKKSVGNTRHNNFFRGSQVPSAPIHSLLLVVDIVGT
jgi:hypothetical protein